MEEIRIYYSFWKRLLLNLLFIVSFVAMIWFFAADEGIRDADAMMVFCIILFCFFFLFYLFLLFNSLVEKVSHRPCMVISDKGIAVNGLLKKKFINFSDVVRFELRQITWPYNELLVIYNPEASKKILEGLNVILRLIRQKENYQEGLDILFIDMEAKKLCNLLNERLSQIPSSDVKDES